MSSQKGNITVCGFIHSGVDWLEKIVRCLSQNQHTYNQSELSIIGCTNTLPPSFPDGWISSTNKLLFILRNPKDIVSVSYCTEGDCEKDFGSFLETFVSSRSHESGAISWCNHTVQWGDFLKTLPTDTVLIVYFEDLICNLRDELCKICSFLGVHYDNRRINEWCDILDIDAHKNGPVRKRQKVDNSNRRLDHDVIYETGMWKRYFMVGQSEAFDTFMRTKMVNSSLGIDRYL